MQKINIKKYTKEQMLKMLETAYEANESATAELERTAAQIHAQQEEIAVLRAKLVETKSAYDAAMDDEERRVRELKEQGSELARANEARKKAESEGRELAKQLGEREIELAKVKQECESELAKQRVEAEKAFMKMHATIEGLLKRLEAQKDISEDYHKSLKWCMAHPWRNLWRCMKEHFRF